MSFAYAVSNVIASHEGNVYELVLCMIEHHYFFGFGRITPGNGSTSMKIREALFGSGVEPLPYGRYPVSICLQCVSTTTYDGLVRKAHFEWCHALNLLDMFVREDYVERIDVREELLDLVPAKHREHVRHFLEVVCDKDCERASDL